MGNDAQVDAPEAPAPDTRRGADADLIAAFQRGETAAFDDLVRRHAGRVHGLALRLTGSPEDAAELAQDAFVRAYRSLDDFRGEAAFASWLYRIVVNLARNRHRDGARRGRDRAVSLEAMQAQDPGHEVAAHASENPRTAAQRAELQTLLQEALDALPAMYREAFVLRVHQDLSYEAIAAVLECPVGTVRSRLNSARRQLHAWLRERGAV